MEHCVTNDPADAGKADYITALSRWEASKPPYTLIHSNCRCVGCAQPAGSHSLSMLPVCLPLPPACILNDVGHIQAGT